MLPIAKTTDVFLSLASTGPMDTSHRIKLPCRNVILSTCYPLFLLTNRISQNLNNKLLIADFDLIKQELYHITILINKTTMPEPMKKATQTLCYYFVNYKLQYTHETLWQEYLSQNDDLNVPISHAEFEKIIQHCVRYPKEYHLLLELVSWVLGLIPIDNNNEQLGHLYEQVTHELNLLQQTTSDSDNVALSENKTSYLGQLYIIILLSINLLAVFWIMSEYYRTTSIDLVINGWLR